MERSADSNRGSIGTMALGGTEMMNGLKLLSWGRLKTLGRLVGLYLCLVLVCCGCVQYRMELSFNWLTGGTIVQNLKWDSNVGNFIGNYSDTAAEELLEEIERRAAAAGGTADYISDSEMRVEIPFDNYTQLETKFNSFFNQPLLLLSQLPRDIIRVDPVDSLADSNQNHPKIDLAESSFATSASSIAKLSEEAPTKTAIATTLLPSKPTLQNPTPLPQTENLIQRLAQSSPEEDFKVTKHGYLVADRYDLTYTLDLTDIRLPVSGSFFTLSVDRLLDLQMALTTPIPASHSNATVRDGNRLEWQLDTGTVNHLSVSFWSPSPLGIALIAAIAVVAFLWVWRLDRPRRRG